jgi:dienelactone hydrolase
MTTIQAATLNHSGANLEGYLAIPDAPGPHGAVMVMHNAHGLGEHVRKVAQRLAESGYVALATDMHGGGRFYGGKQDWGTIMAPYGADPDLLRSRTIAWFEWLRSRPEVDADRIGAMGYCFGGQCVLELARSAADVKVVVSLHGTLRTAKPAEAGAVKGQVVIYAGELDPFAPRKDIDAFQDEMNAAGARWHITVFGGVYHSFTDPIAAESGLEGLGYDPLADRLSWAGTEALLGALL